MEDSNQRPQFYRRNLPHFMPLGKPVFVTFCTIKRWILPKSVRAKVLDHCIYEDGKRIHLLCAVVMPDHVHMIFDLLADKSGLPLDYPRIVGNLRSISAHSVNRILKRHGNVWQDEPMDHILRSDEQGWIKVEYVVNNPVRAGLAQRAADYPWLWVNPNLKELRDLPVSVKEAIYKQQGILTAEGGCATQLR